jgi:hypothetical protein
MSDVDCQIIFRFDKLSVVQLLGVYGLSITQSKFNVSQYFLMCSMLMSLKVPYIQLTSS